MYFGGDIGGEFIRLQAGLPALFGFPFRRLATRSDRHFSFCHPDRRGHHMMCQLSPDPCNTAALSHRIPEGLFLPFLGQNA